MYLNRDAWMLEKIFHLSDRALIRMVNHLFRKEYEDGECIQKEWGGAGAIRICLTVGCANRYEFRMRRLGGCLQICAQDRGCRFYYEDAAVHPALQIGESGTTCFGKNIRDEYGMVLEFLGPERVVLPVYNITVSDRSAWRLEEAGLILFLPFLSYCFAAEPELPEIRQESLKSFVIRDIVGALHVSMKKGDLTVFDVQKLKQCCRSMIFRILSGEGWMQDLELQELILDALDADIGLLEHMFQAEDVRRERIF